MARERLYILHGMGQDAVGLVGKITEEVARQNGNIVDLRQDVLHGLFIIYMVVDLSNSSIRLEEFRTTVSRCTEDTGIALQVDNYNPVPRNPEKKNMLVTLLGADHAGLIASVSQLLGKYAVNIEFSRNIGREGVFLMELMTDISSCTIPLENIQSTLSSVMAQKGIKSLFQTDDVFNKKRRVLLFDISLNMMDTSQLTEILQQTGIEPGQIHSLFEDETGRAIARQLEGLPGATYDSITASVRVTPDTMELLQTLKTMGYSIGLIASASSLFVETLAGKCGIDHFYGIPYEIDDDSQCFSGSIDCDFPGINRQQIIDAIVAGEGIDHDDVTIINTGNQPRLPGIHPVFNLGTILDLYNRHTVSRGQFCAIIASFGIGQ